MNKKLLFLIFSLGFSAIVCARSSYDSIESEKEFYRKNDDSRFSVVRFYFYDKSGIKKELRQLKKDDDDEKYKALKQKKKSIKNAIELFKDLSKSERYSKTKVVGFLSVNLALDKNQSLQDMFKVEVFPTYIILENAIPIREDGENVELVGDSSPMKIQEFIEDNIGDELNNIINEQKQQNREEDLARIAAYSYDPFYARWDAWSGPRWYGPYGSRRWWGRPHWRRPRGNVHFGIGFGVSG